MTVGIYAGFGFFRFVGEPGRGITELEVGMEFGGYFGLTLGPLRGEVKLVAGLHFKKDDSGVLIEGYFLCEGRVQLWFIMISARFYMGIRSQGGYVEGRCTVSYEIKLGCFFKLSFQATYSKKIAGASPANNGSASSSGSIQSLSATQNRQISAQSLSADVLRQRASVQAFLSRPAHEQVQAIRNPVKRQVAPLSKNEWRDYLNSYTD
jgi:hypothetical protein